MKDRGPLRLLPDGWPCRLGEAPPGLFLFECNGEMLVGFKSEYSTNTSTGVQPDAFEAAGGSYFSPPGGRADAIVQPVRVAWEREDRDNGTD